MKPLYARPYDGSDPWGLSAGQTQALRAIIDTGGLKAAARALCIEKKTVETHITKARRKMRVTLRLQHFIQFDRWDQVASVAHAPNA